MMENIVRMDSQESKRTRISQACQHCRSLKARCIPSDQPGTCQKCLASKRPCQWSEQQPRAKRTRTGGTSRISQMEQKIDGLVALLVDPEVPQDPKPRPASIHSTPGPTIQNQTPMHVPSRQSPQGNTIPQQIQPLNFDSSQDRAELRHDPSLQTKVDEPSIDQEIMKGLMANGRADDLLQEFRAMSSFFPFVPIHYTATVQTLNRESPMLLLSILTTAAWKDRPLQIALSEQYRLELAHRTLVRPRKTIGMIQSILVYLAWYHFHFNPQSQQLHSLLQLAFGLAMDMGIYHKPKKPFIDISGQSGHATVSANDEREAQRTLLGCYYLSSAFSDALRIPNFFKYTKYMKECGIRLKSDLEYPSDAMLMSMSSLRRIDDQIYDTFLSDDVLDLAASDSRFSMHVQLLESQMKELEENRIDELEHRGFDIQYSFADMVLHNAGPRSNSTTMTTGDPGQLDSLLTCLESGKSFLDKLLAIPVSHYHLVSFVEWMRLPYVLIVISKLSLPNTDHIPGWNIKIAQERVRIDLYLESLCYRMQSLTTFNRVSQPQPDFWLSMVMIMEKTRGWYVRKTQHTAASATANEESPLETVRDPHDDGSENASRPLVVTTTSANATMSLACQPITASDSGNVAMVDDDFFPAIPNFDNLEDFLDGGLWGSGGLDSSMFGGNDMGF
ncbi:hypothetical protein T440DRAFT_429272 [Plenodomus tracheiphilus IPT5]|uniref:Zn(2)-C6 fungal-type domain-containing protein n=1 Tax=Plenodomus tracheiphilus IPT5 TaxID=1408161 RepID=A0A6A7AY83_9PLEO|nr:hypothetical protein T440DRAFT_429272 [Plenodomus tracheiphilus IPT5]